MGSKSKVSPQEALNGATFSPETFKLTYVDQGLILQLFKAINPKLSIADINSLCGNPPVILGLDKRPQSNKQRPQWAETRIINFAGRGPAKHTWRCNHCGNADRGALIADFVAQRSSKRVFCKRCYDGFRRKTPLVGRRRFDHFLNKRYLNRLINTTGFLSQIQAFLHGDVRDFYSAAVPTIRTDLKPGTSEYRRRGALYFAHPWRVLFKVHGQPTSASFFLALFCRTPQRAVSLFQLLISPHEIWNQNWSVMRSFGRVRLEGFKRRCADSNAIIHDASTNERPKERALFIFMSQDVPDQPRVDHYLVSVEMASILSDIYEGRIELTVILDSSTRPTVDAGSVSALTLDGMDKTFVSTHGLRICDADQLTWGLFYLIVNNARYHKVVRDCPCLKVKLQGSYAKAVNTFKEAVHGVRIGCMFSELVSALMDDDLPGNIQMGKNYDPCREQTGLAEHLTRKEIAAFRSGEWPPCDPIPINPELNGCYLSIGGIMKAIHMHPASFRRYSEGEYPPPPDFTVSS